MKKRILVIFFLSGLTLFGLPRPFNNQLAYAVSNTNLINSIRTYFSIAEADVSDEYLESFLDNDSNKQVVIALIKQIDFGKSLSNKDLKIDTPDFFAFMAKKATYGALSFLLQNDPVFGGLWTIASVATTLWDGIKIFIKLADNLANYDVWSLANDYRDGRYSGKSIAATWQEMKSVYEPVILKILRLKGLSEDNLRDFFEMYYQSWILAYNKNGDLDTIRNEFILAGLPNRPPLVPSAPSGPSSGFVGTSYFFSTSTTDPDGDALEYQYDWDWPNGQLSTWGVSKRSYSWDAPGNYQITVRARDSHLAVSEWSTPSSISISVVANRPPNTPSPPSGASSGIVGTNYAFSTSATDPDDDALEYRFDWGDGIISNWGNPSQSHSWALPNSYNISAQARDEHGSESQWSSSTQIAISALPVVTQWPMFLHDAQNTGRSEYSGPQTNNLRWTYILQAGTNAGYVGTPIVGQDGAIYIGAGWMNSGYLYALDKDGNVKWTSPNLGACPNVPAIASDGTVYFGLYDYGSYFYALNPQDGSVKWNFLVGDCTSATKIGQDGTIYFTSETYYLYALEPTGQLKWQHYIGQVTSAPAIGPDGTIYVTWGVWGAVALYAVSPDGNYKWSTGLQVGGNFSTNVSISKDGIIYLCGQYALCAVEPVQGTIIWTFAPGVQLYYCVPIQSNDNKIIVASQGKIYFINASDGIMLNTYDYEDASLVPLQCVVDKDGVVYTSFVNTSSVSGPSEFLAINSDGTEKWSYDLYWPYYTQPAISNGVLYVAEIDQNYNFVLHAFGAPLN